MAFEKAFANYDYICLSTDAKSTNVAVGEVVLETDTNNEYIWDGTAWQEYRMRYKDLGLVIDATNVAAGARVFSPTLDNLQGYDQIITHCKKSNANTGILWFVPVNPATDETSSSFITIPSAIDTNTKRSQIQQLKTTANQGTTKKMQVAFDNTGSIPVDVKIWIQLINTQR